MACGGAEAERWVTCPPPPPSQPHCFLPPISRPPQLAGTWCNNWYRDPHLRYMDVSPADELRLCAAIQLEGGRQALRTSRGVGIELGDSLGEAAAAAAVAVAGPSGSSQAVAVAGPSGSSQAVAQGAQGAAPTSTPEPIQRSAAAAAAATPQSAATARPAPGQRAPPCKPRARAALGWAAALLPFGDPRRQAGNALRERQQAGARKS